MKIELIGGVLAALLAGLGLGGDWDANDSPPPPPPTVCAPGDDECGVYKPPPGASSTHKPRPGASSTHKPKPGASSTHKPKPAVCPDDGVCAPHLPPPARRS